MDRRGFLKLLTGAIAVGFHIGIPKPILAPVESMVHKIIIGIDNTGATVLRPIEACNFDGTVEVDLRQLFNLPHDR